MIGGSGFYELAGFTDRREVVVETPFGSPSDALTVGQLGGMGVAFLPRHGRGHRITPSELPVQANIHALKQLGVQWVISVGAVGSMREEIRPLDLVVPDQLFDRTKSRPSTFFGDGLVVHVGFAEPFCPLLSQALLAAAREVGARVHAGGTYVCIEGPQFSTKAESRIYRQWGVDVIGMTALPEAKLAREAEALLCHPGPLDRLRRLARVGGAGDGRDGRGQPAEKRRDEQAGRASDRRRPAHRALVPLPGRRCATLSSRSRRKSRRTRASVSICSLASTSHECCSFLPTDSPTTVIPAEAGIHQPPRIVVTGTIGLDTVETPFGKVEAALGGSASYFALAASLYSVRQYCQRRRRGLSRSLSGATDPAPY